MVDLKKPNYKIVLLIGLIILVLFGGYSWGKNEGERPYKETGYMIAFIDLSHAVEGYAPWYAFSSGEASHLGKFTSYAWGINNFVDQINAGHGFQIAANGDRIYLETLETAEGPLGTITGGTGRFEDIESCGGGLRMIDPDSETFEMVDDLTAIMTYRYKTTGCIKY